VKIKKNGKLFTLTESDLKKIIKKVINENNDMGRLLSTEMRDELLYLLNQIIEINLKNAPRLEILDITADDLEGANTNTPIHLKNSIASMETMEKYVVPYKGNIRIPVPIEDNWDIYELTLGDLRTLVDELKSLPDAEFKDLFRIAKNVGNFLFQYY